MLVVFILKGIIKSTNLKLVGKYAFVAGSATLKIAWQAESGIVGPGLKMPRQKLYQRETHFQFADSYREISTHIQGIRNKFGCARFETNDFLAIALHKADKEKFELDFHDLERKMLKKRGCVKKVIMLIKYLRDIQMGSMDKIWSHLIKVKRFRYIWK